MLTATLNSAGNVVISGLPIGLPFDSIGQVAVTLPLDAATLGAATVSAPTLSAATGVNTVFGADAGGFYRSGGGSTLFVGATGSVTGASTVIGGFGNDTIFAQAGVDYVSGPGNATFIGAIASALAAGGSAASTNVYHSTVIGGVGHDTLFGGTVGDLYVVNGASDTLINGGGADTVVGGTVAPTLFGDTGGDVRLMNTAAGAQLVAGGTNETIDASAANQGSAFFANDLASVGNTTLVGSANAPSGAAADQFVLASVAGAHAAHTITIENYQTGESLFLSGYGAADGQAFANAVSSNAAQGGGLAVTLSDGATIQFVGNHPTATFDGGGVAL